MKKKIVVLLSLVLVMCSLLCACGNNNAQGKSNDSNGNGGNNNQSNETQSGSNDESETEKNYLTDREVAEYLELIELTTENWKDYIEIVSKDVENKDAFGEVIDTSTRYVMQIKDMGQFSQGFIDGAKIEAKNLKTGDIKLWDDLDGGGGSVTFFDEAYTLEDFECTRISGKLVLLKNIPEKYIHKNENNEEFIEIGNEYSTDIYYKGKSMSLSYYVQFIEK